MKSKEVKQKEATARQIIYDNLSITERIKRAQSRCGKSEKEINKLIIAYQNSLK